MSVGVRLFKAGNHICLVEAGIRLDDLVDRQSVLKVLKQNLDRHAGPPEDSPAAEDLWVSNDDVCHGALTDLHQVMVDK